jgi:hypothetical protein
MLWSRLADSQVLVREEAGHNTVKRPWGPERSSGRYVRLDRARIAQLLGTVPSVAGGGTVVRLHPPSARAAGDESP